MYIYVKMLWAVHIMYISLCVNYTSFNVIIIVFYLTLENFFHCYSLKRLNFLKYYLRSTTEFTSCDCCKKSYHKHSGWKKNINLFSYSFWRSQVWNRSHLAKTKLFLEALGESLLPWLFRGLHASLGSWPLPSSSVSTITSLQLALPSSTLLTWLWHFHFPLSLLGLLGLIALHLK